MGHQKRKGVHAIYIRWAAFLCFLQGKPHGSHLFLLTIVPEQDGTLEVKPLTYACCWKTLIFRHLFMCVCWRWNERAPPSNDLFLFNSDLSSQSEETPERLSTAAGHTYIHTYPNTLKFTAQNLSLGPESHEHHGQLIVCSGFMKSHGSQDESTHVWVFMHETKTEVCKIHTFS